MPLGAGPGRAAAGGGRRGRSRPRCRGGKRRAGAAAGAALRAESARALRVSAGPGSGSGPAGGSPGQGRQVAAPACRWFGGHSPFAGRWSSWDAWQPAGMGLCSICAGSPPRPGPELCLRPSVLFPAFPPHQPQSNAGFAVSLLSLFAVSSAVRSLGSPSRGRAVSQSWCTALLRSVLCGDLSLAEGLLDAPLLCVCIYYGHP